MRIKITIILFFFSVLGFSQSNNADVLLNNIKTKLNKVNDYSANVEVAVKMDFLKMPKSNAEIFFKKPDKFKFHSTGFAILPKAGFDFNPQKILDNDLTVKIIGDTLLDETKLKIIKITPKIDSLKFTSAILLIEEVHLLIYQITISADKGVTIVTNFKYGQQSKFALPSELSVSFDLSNIEKNEAPKKRRSKIPENFKGEISIKYYNYKVNLGIDDSIFIDEEKLSDSSENTKK